MVKFIDTADAYQTPMCSIVDIVTPFSLDCNSAGTFFSKCTVSVVFFVNHLANKTILCQKKPICTLDIVMKRLSRSSPDIKCLMLALILGHPRMQPSDMGVTFALDGIQMQFVTRLSQNI